MYLKQRLSSKSQDNLLISVKLTKQPLLIKLKDWTTQRCRITTMIQLQREIFAGPILGVSCACTTADFHPARGPCVFDAALGEKRMQLTFMRVTDCSDGKGPPPPLKGLGCEEYQYLPTTHALGKNHSLYVGTGSTG